MISNISNPFALPQPLRSTNPKPAGTPGAFRASAVTIHSTSHLGGTLELQTREGDVVSISLSQDRDATYSRVGGRHGHFGGHGRGFASQSSVSVQNAFSIQVQGSLNEKEQADVDALVSTFRRAAELFASGNQDGANQLLAGFESLGAIDGFSSNFESSRTFDVVRTRLGGGRSRPETPIVHEKPEPVVTGEPIVGTTKPVATPTPLRQTEPAPPIVVDPYGGAIPVDTGRGGGIKPSDLAPNSHDDLIRRLDEGRRQFAAWLQGEDAAANAPKTIASVL